MAPFATSTQVSRRLGRALTQGEAAAADYLCESATALIAEAADKTDAWADTLDPVPRALQALCVEVAARSLANPGTLQSVSETLGQYQYNQSFRPEGLMLTEDEQRFARRVIFGGVTKGSTGEQESVVDLIPFRFPTANAWIDLALLGEDDPAAYLPASDE